MAEETYGSGLIPATESYASYPISPDLFMTPIDRSLPHQRPIRQVPLKEPLGQFHALHIEVADWLTMCERGVKLRDPERVAQQVRGELMDGRIVDITPEDIRAMEITPAKTIIGLLNLYGHRLPQGQPALLDDGEP